MEAAPIQRLPVVMTVKRVAGLLECPESTVERYIHGHELRAVQIGREKRVLGVDLWDFLCRRRSTAEVRGR